MRKYSRKIAMVITVLMVLSTAVFAADEAEIEVSTSLGMEWLADAQNGDGSWGTYEYVAHTGLAVLKFETHAVNMGIDPFDLDYEYSDEIEAGLNYIFNQSYYTACGLVSSNTGHETYNTSIALMALSASKNPDRIVPGAIPVVGGMTYLEVAEEYTDFLINTQATALPHEGGWGYGCSDTTADNSNSGYAVLALEYAENPFYEFSIEIPDSLRDHLEVWISNIQDPVTGASYYEVGWAWPNILKAGNLIQQMNFVGYPVTDSRVELTLGYIANHFYDTGSEGWYSLSEVNKQAAFTMMKGLESYGIEILDPDGVAIDWFDEVSDRLIAEQTGAGYWSGDTWAPNAYICTAWSLLTLQKVSPPLTVDIDIKPGSDPNGVNLKNNGVIPVAILATDDFDPTVVDPATVLFEGAAPLRWVFEDVDFDGDMDLLFHFNAQETEIMPGDPDATLIGETLSGKAFSGVDTVKTVPKQ